MLIFSVSPVIEVVSYCGRILQCYTLRIINLLRMLMKIWSFPTIS